MPEYFNNFWWIVEALTMSTMFLLGLQNWIIWDWTGNRKKSLMLLDWLTVGIFIGSFIVFFPDRNWTGLV